VCTDTPVDTSKVTVSNGTVLDSKAFSDAQSNYQVPAVYPGDPSSRNTAVSSTCCDQATRVPRGVTRRARDVFSIEALGTPREGAPEGRCTDGVRRLNKMQVYGKSRREDLQKVPSFGADSIGRARNPFRLAILAVPVLPASDRHHLLGIPRDTGGAFNLEPLDRDGLVGCPVCRRR
jgi:hypothetical protein